MAATGTTILSELRIEALQHENAQLSATVADLSEQLAQVKAQLNWFRQALFGPKSEKRLDLDPAEQASLFEALGLDLPPAADMPTQEISYRRRAKRRDGSVNEQRLRFDDSVPVETIVVTDPEIEAIPEAEREVIGEKVTHRLAQTPDSYKILKYVRQVVKRRDTGEVRTPPTPPNVLGRAAVDVSFLAGLLVDKFCYHLPLYRQHRRLSDSGIRVSRRSLTNWAGRAIDLLEPIVSAQSAHILTGDVIAMDETSIKAGRTGPGRMRSAYYWPVYGQDDELTFHYAPSRAHEHVETFLGDFRGTLLSDGYAAYEAFARRRDLVHARCWAHCRRKFAEARSSDPEAADRALVLIGALYRHEKRVRKKKLNGADKLAWRRERSAPAVDAFFAWCQQQRQRTDRLPNDPFGKALAYAADREAGWRVFLDDPEVAIDTNHLERGLRPIPMGRKNWLFAWTEVGAIQSLLVTCQMQGVNPYLYLVDVLQRIDRHPAKRVIELTPRVWKDLFADDPLLSNLDRARDPPNT